MIDNWAKIAVSFSLALCNFLIACDDHCIAREIQLKVRQSWLTCGEQKKDGGLENRTPQLLPLYSLQQYYFVGKQIHMHSRQILISCNVEVLNLSL